MRLRARLALTTLLVAIPVVLAVLWLDARARHVAARDDLARLARRHMLATGERARCEQDPARWGGHPLPPPDDDRPRGDSGRPAPPRDRPRGPPPGDGGPPPGDGPGGPPPGPPNGTRVGGPAPVLFAYDASLAAADPRAPAITEAPGVPLWPTSEVEILLDMPWTTGPCARILALGGTNPDWLGGLLPQSPVWLLAIGAIWLALLVSIGPVVRRLRSLTRAVSASASTGFTAEVPLVGTDEVGDLARAFDAASREVRKQLGETERRERALREFVANTTHDTMIPLTVLRAHLAQLDDQLRTAAPVDRELLRGAITEADYLGALTANLGTAAKLDATEPAVVWTTVDLNATIERVLARHQMLARQAGVSVDGAVPDPPVTARADVTLIEQALNNLVHNAIRYNRSGGHVAVVLDRTAGGRFVITVADDGPGIPDDQRARVLQRGVRGADAVRRGGPGHGLGLSIAAQVAALMQLELELGRSDEGGVRVTLTGQIA